MQQKALNVARKYEDDATERLRRINLIAASLDISQDKKLGGTDQHVSYPLDTTTMTMGELNPVPAQ